jgi:hypothetical protein
MYIDAIDSVSSLERECLLKRSEIEKSESQPESGEINSHQSNWRWIGQLFCYLCAITWLLTGILYSYDFRLKPQQFKQFGERGGS